MRERDVDISGLDKAEVLLALHRGTHAVGLGKLQDRGLSLEDARACIQQQLAIFADFPEHPSRLDFDYVMGRPIKVDLKGDSFDPLLYDRDAGPGAAAWAISALRLEKEKEPK